MKIIKSQALAEIQKKNNNIKYNLFNLSKLFVAFSFYSHSHVFQTITFLEIPLNIFRGIFLCIDAFLQCNTSFYTISFFFAFICEACVAAVIMFFTISLDAIKQFVSNCYHKKRIRSKGDSRDLKALTFGFSRLWLIHRVRI